MTASDSVSPVSLATVKGLIIDHDYLRHTVASLTAIGSSSLGFRNAGTAEDAAVASFVANEMRAIGLVDMACEGVEVDAWRFKSASVSTKGSHRDLSESFLGVSFGGVPPTPTQGITAALVDAKDGKRSQLDLLEMRGAIALIDWRDPEVHPSAVVLEIAARGALGMIVNSPEGGHWYQSPHALGSFDGHWPVGAPPMVFIQKEDAVALRNALGRNSELAVQIDLDVELEPLSNGQNVVGYLPGEVPGPIVVGAHHDAWFQGAFDNASGVAAVLAMAKALTETGHRPRHTICFSTRTAEEYGIAGSVFDWCIGAWQQVQLTHPEWGTNSPFHLCVEATGHRELRTALETPVELTAWAERIGTAAAQEGWTPTGWRTSLPVTGTEQWPLLISGIPGVAAYSWESKFGRTDYHTQFDNVDLLDFSYLEAQTRLYALLVLEADRDPDSIIDHRARAAELSQIAEANDHQALLGAAAGHYEAIGRKAFTAVGQSLLAVDAQEATCYPHEQALRDLNAIGAAIGSLDLEDLLGAALHLGTVGQHNLFPYLSAEVFRAHSRRFERKNVARSWASGSHLTLSPIVWDEIASLRGETGAEKPGPWIRTSLTGIHNQLQAELRDRLDGMARSIQAIPGDSLPNQRP